MRTVAIPNKGNTVINQMPKIKIPNQNKTTPISSSFLTKFSYT